MLKAVFRKICNRLAIIFYEDTHTPKMANNTCDKGEHCYVNPLQFQTFICINIIINILCSINGAQKKCVVCLLYFVLR